jgi:C4-type Zn-finger protein
MFPGIPNECPWCAADLTYTMEVEHISYDGALEAHVDECEGYERESAHGEVRAG